MRVEELIGISRGILFDFNGTLSNDEGLLEQAYDSALLQLGLTRLNAGEYAALLGRSDPDIAQAVLEHRGEGSRINEFLSALADIYPAASISDGCLTPDSVAFVKWLLNNDKKVGIVTGTLRSMIEPVLAEYGLAEELNCLVTIEDVQAGKPDPEGFALGAQLLAVKAQEILVFEDSNAGLAAADSLGMRVVGIGGAIETPRLAAHYSTMDDVAAEVVALEGS